MNESARVDGRAFDELRPISVETGTQRNPEGSVLYRQGGTTVLISVSVDERVPKWMKGQGKGWLTAEYAMHPRANARRQTRDGRGPKLDARSQEIQRLIGRSLRAAVLLEQIGERTITVDCDVLDGDGGTRCASITAGFVGVALALQDLREKGLLGAGVLRSPVAAISVGQVGDAAALDLCYLEDRDAEMDLNVVGTRAGDIIEVQGTAEGAPIPRSSFDALVARALGAMETLGQIQADALEAAGVDLAALIRT